MLRFLVSQKEGNAFIFDKNNQERIKANRLRENEHILCLYENEYYEASISKNKANIIKKLDINNEFKHDIVYALPLIKYKKIDLLVQKLTELGVKKLQLLLTENISVKYTIDDLKKKIERWEAISKAACEQSFRNNCLKILMPIKFDDFLKQYLNYNKFIAHEKQEVEESFFLEGDLVLVSGPEGGLTQDEVEKALKNNFKVISLGKTILRAESAAIKLASLIKTNN
ncbi:16S rRNA (uracil(1498)-N(3))-methyltransferase [Mycoplasma phocimorsus]|uniref:16S rRNA (uracil(1498)-N(3))-methyltransferase n=1 Tax=Mycoplasma phocimorsus TaxID=3045839 RepID=UPI0024BF705E|nr:RsmE family RNA methyltransferase [Mycoplasma phocimorsus]MDJ1648588.1 RsmE family RNA methyltransferase [Mycoplasma phocimorsus]